MPDLVEALYPYQPQSPDDMALEPGNRIEVIEHLSHDWARGKNLTTGKEGVFPKNYVKLVEEQSRDEKFSRPAAPIPPSSTGSSAQSQPQKFDDKQQYQPPSANWQQQPPQYQPPQQYQQYQPPQQQFMPPPQQQQPPPPQQEQHHHHRLNGAFGNLARRFGDSVVFGAGATLGSDIMNKIF